MCGNKPFLLSIYLCSSPPFSSYSSLHIYLYFFSHFSSLLLLLFPPSPLFVCIFIYLSPSFYLFISVCLCIYLSIFLSISLCIYFCLSYLFIYLFLCENKSYSSRNGTEITTQVYSLCVMAVHKQKTNKQQQNKTKIRKKKGVTTNTAEKRPIRVLRMRGEGNKLGGGGR